MKYCALVLILGIISCNSPEKITNTKWELTEMLVEDKVQTIPEGVVLNFSDDGTIVGFAGCNNFFGKYTLGQKDELQILVEGTTMTMCEHQSFEDNYLKNLREEYKIKTKANTLILDGKITLIYNKK